MPKKYSIPKDAERFAKDLDFACVKLFQNHEISYMAKLKPHNDDKPHPIDDKYYIKIEINNEAYINTSNNIGLLVFNDLMDETSSSQIKEKMLFYCKVGEHLAKSKNYFAQKEILVALREYAYRIRKKKINNEYEAISNYEEIYNEINKATKVLDNSQVHIKSGIKPENYIDGVMIPCMHKTFGNINAFAEYPKTNCSTDQEKNQGLIQFRKRANQVIGFVNKYRDSMSAAFKPNEDEDESSTALYLTLISGAPDFKNKTVKKVEERKIFLEDMHRTRVTSKSVYLKSSKSKTLTKMQGMFNSMETAYHEPLLVINAPVSNNSQVENNALTNYISYILYMMQKKNSNLAIDMSVVEFMPYLQQIMNDHGLDVDDDPAEFAEIFTSYADMNLLYGNELNEQDNNNWNKKFQLIESNAKQYYPEITLNRDRKEYVKLILSSLQKQTDFSEFTKQHKTQKYFRKLIQEHNVGLTLYSSAEDFINTINKKILEFDINSTDKEYIFYRKLINYFNKSYPEYNNRITGKLIIDKVNNTKRIQPPRVSNVSTETSTMQENPLFRDSSGISVTTNSELNDSLGIKSQLESVLNELNEVNEYSIQDDDSNYLKTVLEYEDDETLTLSFEKNGKTAYMDSIFNEDNYRRLTKIFIRTNDIVDPEIVKPMNVPREHQARALEIISEIIEEYQLAKENDSQLGI
ncbi:MAG: hypothetical protein HRT87_04345 [Legionellales bacterium]|nr:hypothetical protein [Legionellales bacterium]